MCVESQNILNKIAFQMKKKKKIFHCNKSIMEVEELVVKP